MDIKAAVVREKGGKFLFEDLQLEDPRDNEVLVRVVACGVCHTDLGVRDQYYPTPLPAVLGHEGSGVVEKVGKNVTKVQPGDHVVMSVLCCGKCHACLSGKPTYCENMYLCNFSGGRLDGTSPLSKNGERINGCFFSQSTFATHAIATEANVVKVSKDVPLELLGPLGCGIQTGAGTVMNALHPNPGTSIVIFGMGSVGLSALMAAKICGCTKIIAVDLSDERLELAKSFGATHGINGMKTDTVKAVHELTGGGADYSVEAIGNPKVFRQAVDCISVTGMCGLIGMTPMGTEVSFDMNGLLFGRNVKGVIEGDSVIDVFIPRLIDLYLQGSFPFDRLITYYDFADLNKAVEDLEKGKVFKGIVKM